MKGENSGRENQKSRRGEEEKTKLNKEKASS